MLTRPDAGLRFLRFQGPVIAYLIIITLVSSLPGDKIPPLGLKLGDKVIHALEFGLLGIFMFRALRFPRMIVPVPYRATLVLGMLFAAVDEIHQYFVPGRYCTFGDFLADTIGIALFAGISAFLHPGGEKNSSLF